MTGFMKEKMKERLKFHKKVCFLCTEIGLKYYLIQKGDYKELIEDLGDEVLPAEYGGKNEDLETLQSELIRE